ncbi:MAG: SIMPL domain-containing protein [Clostridiales bacterium]|jgi:uncharacterized protein YggE|nr:SIMPL domain-containing protein [Clostridiales bacterium]
MPRTITVKGIGKVSLRPDYVVLSMALESRSMNYEEAMETAAESIELLNKALSGADFEKDAVKTTNFNVRTEYDDELHKDGSFKRVFKGYIVTHNLKAEFDFDSVRLSKTLSAVGSCPAHPQLNVAFTVKETAAVYEEVLRSAAENAGRKAEILCKASGVALKDLLSIDYNWGELNFYSGTRYNVAEDCLAAPMKARSIEIEPDDINISETAAFVWEISEL